VPKTAVIDRGAGQPPAHPFKRWLFADLEVKGTQGAAHQTGDRASLVEGDVFDRCGLFFHAWLPAGHRLLSRRRAVASGLPWCSCC
jgi:hypothetical protein